MSDREPTFLSDQVYLSKRQSLGSINPHVPSQTDNASVAKQMPTTIDGDHSGFKQVLGVVRPVVASPIHIDYHLSIFKVKVHKPYNDLEEAWKGLNGDGVRLSTVGTIACIVHTDTSIYIVDLSIRLIEGKLELEIIPSSLTKPILNLFVSIDGMQRNKGPFSGDSASSYRCLVTEGGDYAIGDILYPGSMIDVSVKWLAS